jgi:hypothetical protein
MAYNSLGAEFSGFETVVHFVTARKAGSCGRQSKGDSIGMFIASRARFSIKFEAEIRGIWGSCQRGTPIVLDYGER